MTTASESATEIQFLKEYLSDGRLMQVATASPSGQPWLVHVWYAHDASLDLLFISNVARRHSDMIRVNPAVAGGIVAIELVGLGQKVRGVMFEGSCVQLSGSDVLDAYDVYHARWPTISAAGSKEQFAQEETPMRFYRITPARFVLFDEDNFPSQPRREIVAW